MMLLMLLVGFAFTGIESVFGLWTQARDGWGPRQIGACFACVGVVAAITQLGFTGRPSRRHGEGAMLAAGMAVMAARSALRPFSPSGRATVLLLMVTAIGQSVAFPNIGALISRAADPARRGQILGLNNACGALARIVGPSCAGLAFAVPGHDVPFFMAAAVATPTIFLAVSASRRALHHPVAVAAATGDATRTGFAEYGGPDFGDDSSPPDVAAPHAPKRSGARS